MYTEQDYLRVIAKKNKRLVMVFLILGLMIVTMVVGLVTRERILTTVGAAFFGCLFYAVLELKVMPWVRYGRYLRDMKVGLSHATDAEFVSISHEPRANSGVMFYDLVVRVGPEPEDERLFYYDADKPLPSFSEGEKLHIVSFGNYITSLG